MVRTFFRRLLCQHDFVFHRQVFGDEIVLRGYRREIWRCRKCGETTAR